LFDQVILFSLKVTILKDKHYLNLQLYFSCFFGFLISLLAHELEDLRLDEDFFAG